MLARLAVVLVLMSALFIFCRTEADAQIRHEVFLPNTDHELHVYRIIGDEPGKTIMIIGGIQGDEPGGYLSADLYADIHLKKGNLIVVPRANFYSILLNRREGLTGDMNRKFGPEATKGRNLEEEVVTILKHLIAESDCLLNLHEGSGYYNPAYVDETENPMRFGQSIIYDAASYKVDGGKRVIELEEFATRVTLKVNEQISNSRYHFRPNNHNTVAENSPHKEQRKSATYYALTQAHIPAFGIETTKFIASLDVKISLCKQVINTIMTEFGIVHDPPGINIDPPKLDYLLVKVNDGFPYALPQGARIELNPGDNIVVTDIIANYERGLAADVEGFGTTNDTNRPFRLTRTTRITVRKDAQQCGWVELALRGQEKVEEKTLVAQAAKTPPTESVRVEELFFDVDGVMKTLSRRNNTLKVRKGVKLTMQKIKTNLSIPDKEIQVNFKGFNPPKSVNDGNDLLYSINTQDLLARYAVGKGGKRYPIVATYKDQVIGEFFVEVQ